MLIDVAFSRNDLHLVYFLENFRETNVNHVFLTENSGEEVSKRTVVCKYAWSSAFVLILRDRFFNEPSLGICLDKDGFLLVCDTKNHWYSLLPHVYASHDLASSACQSTPKASQLSMQGASWNLAMWMAI